MPRPAFFPGLFAVALLMLGAAVVEFLMPRHCAPVPVARHGQASACTDLFEKADRSFREP